MYIRLQLPMWEFIIKVQVKPFTYFLYQKYGSRLAFEMSATNEKTSLQ